MRRKISVLMVIGLLFTITASAGTYFYLRVLERDLETAQAKLEQFSQIVSVPVLVRDVARGGQIVEDDVTSEQISTSHLPYDLVRALGDVAPGDGGPLIARTDLKAGQFLLRAHLATPAEVGSAEVLLPVGSRAYALRPANSDAFDGRIAPGDPVDVFWRAKGAEEATETRLLATRLEVARPYVRPDALAEAGAGAAAAQGADGAPPAASAAQERVVLVGPAEEIALLIQTDGRGEHMIVPANHTAYVASEQVAVNDEDVTARPLAARSADAARRQADVGDSRSMDNDNVTDEPENAVKVIQSLVKAPPTCTLNIVRSATRSVIEVPC